MAITAVVAATGACGDKSKDSATPASSGTTAATATASANTPTAAPSSPAGNAGTGNTKEICDAIDKELGDAKAALIVQGTALSLALAQNNTAEANKARGAIQTAANQWVKTLQGNAAKATDPAFKAALNQTADNLAKFATADNLAKYKTAADAEKLGSDLAAVGEPIDKYCV